MSKLDTLQASLERILVGQVASLERSLGELTLTVSAAQYAKVASTLQSHPDLVFEQLIDLCGLDYSAYKDRPWEGARFAVVSHLLSVSRNWRLRLRVFCPDDELPTVTSVTGIWASANWFEREAFDLFGIIFEGHEDLRRILTDYGFIGHPFRKDFPTHGHVEMRFDAEQKRVVYQPVSIELREITPRIIREDQYGGLSH